MIQDDPGSSQCPFCGEWYYTHSKRKGTESEMKKHASKACLKDRPKLVASATKTRAITGPVESLEEARKWDKRKLLYLSQGMSDRDAARKAWG